MRKLHFFSATIVLALLPEGVSAHSFGVLYNLPVPFWMYLYGSAAAVALSFLVIGYFFSEVPKESGYPTRILSRHFFSDRARARISTVARAVSVGLFILTILTGLFGVDSSYSNFNMNFFWIICLLGLTYLSALIGNVYSILNPWKILTTHIGEQGIFTYPTWLRYYPAFALYYLLIWFELLGKPSPSKLSVALILYTVLNYAGVITFGKTVWFRYGEFFSVFWRLVSKMAPVERRDGKLYLRPPFIGLIKEQAEHVSLLFFTLFMLSSTAFDGVKDTLPFVRIYWQDIDPLLRPLLGTSSYRVFQSVCLLLSPFVFFVLYVLLIAAAKRIAKSALSLTDILLTFAFSLVPIALAYNIAHYYTLIFSEGPSIVRLISDPFGFGWNLFGTAGSTASVILDAGFVWHSQVFVIVAGHVAGVYLAHLASLKVFPASRTRALISQLPMVVLMMSYTMIGLWILSQPITGGTL
jgi:hypothetical protein